MFYGREEERERERERERQRERRRTEQSASRSDDMRSSSRQRSESSRSRKRERQRERELEREREMERDRERGRRGGSQTSMGDSRRHRSRSRFRMHNDDYDASERLLNEDFKLMLALTPTPDEAFCPKSLDHARAVRWRNKLTEWQCDTIHELRMRQAYMSYFSVCLNQKQLRGIFQQEPQNTLCWVDFQDVIVPNGGCMASMGDDSAWLTMLSTLQNQGSCCSRPTMTATTTTTTTTKETDSTTGSRHAGGANSRRKNMPGTTHKLAYKSRPKLVPKSNLSLSQSSSCRSSFGSKDCDCDCDTASSLSLVAEPRPHRQRRPIDQQTRKDMDYLLAIITAELRGEQRSEPDDYFELELKRYREFYARHRYKDPDYQSLVASANSSKERIHMLLNMQNDLIKLLSK